MEAYFTPYRTENGHFMDHYRAGAHPGLCFVVVVVWGMVLGSQVLFVCQCARRVVFGPIDSRAKKISVLVCGITSTLELIDMGGG